MACVLIPRQRVIYPRIVRRCHRPCLQSQCGTGPVDYLLRELVDADDSYYVDSWYSHLPQHLFLASLMELLVNSQEDKETSETSKTDKKTGDKKDTSSDCSEEAENQETVDKSEEKETPENFKLAVSVGNFKPEHLKLTVSEGKLSIVGKYVHETDHGNGIYSTEERQFRQSYTLPDNVNTDQLISKFDESGKLLTFEAPLKAIEEQKERPIPITVEKSTVSIECPESCADLEGDISTKSEQFPGNSENMETATEKECESECFECNCDAGSQ